MNDKQIDMLLEELKNTVPAEINDDESDGALLDKVKCRIQKRQRQLHACYAIVAAILVCVGTIWLLHDVNDDHSSITASTFQPLLMTMDLFPETGVALINDEVSTCSQQQEESKTSYVRLSFLAPDGTTWATLDVAVADDDYIELDTEALAGSLMFSPCTDNEMVIDIGLTFRRTGQPPIALRGIVAVSDHAVCQLENNGMLVVERLCYS